MAGRGTTATGALERAGLSFALHENAHDPRHATYGLEASQALGIPPERVFKTLIAEMDGTLVAGVVPVTGQLDLKALATAVGGKKAGMAPVAAVPSPALGLRPALRLRPGPGRPGLGPRPLLGQLAGARAGIGRQQLSNSGQQHRPGEGLADDLRRGLGPVCRGGL